MIALVRRSRFGPIGIDIGSRSVKLLQLDGQRSAIVEAARWDLPADWSATPERADEAVVAAIRQARQGRNFRGREAVLCVGAGDLFVQNIRVAQVAGDQLHRLVHAEAAGRLPFPKEEAELRYIEAADVRQGDTMRREVILLACRRAAIERAIAVAEQAGLEPLAIDAQPAALVRCYARQYRRDNDQQRRTMFVHIGASSTMTVIARGQDLLFVKPIDSGGRHMDEAVAQHLNMPIESAAALRRHNGDRRADQRDPEVARSLLEAIRPVLDRLGNELSMSLRYHSVTFRGEPVSLVVLGGGEASESLAEFLAARLEIPCELGHPVRSFRNQHLAGRVSQWDVAAGLALREDEVRR